MTETKTLPAAIWTPWAEVLCEGCYNMAGTPIGKAYAGRTVTVPVDDDHVGHCDRCEAEVADDFQYIVGLQNIARRIGAKLEQTGGMCSAAVKPLKDERTYVVTDNRDGSWLVSIYDKGAWEEYAEDTEDFQWLTADKVVAHVARLEGK